MKGEIFELTRIDPWFLCKLRNILACEKQLGAYDGPNDIWFVFTHEVVLDELVVGYQVLEWFVELIDFFARILLISKRHLVQRFWLENLPHPWIQLAQRLNDTLRVNVKPPWFEIKVRLLRLFIINYLVLTSKA